MPTPTIKRMGKAKGPAFVDNLTKASPVKKQNLPMLLLIVAGGVGVLWILRSKSNFAANTAGSTTNPAVSINGGSAPDQSTIDNLTASVLALQGQVTNNPSVPSGGASTPVTTIPSNTTGNGNPGSGNTNYVQGAWSGAANFVQGPGYANVTGTAGGTSVTQGNPAINNGYPTVVFGTVPFTNDAAGTAGWLNTLIATGPAKYQGPATGNNAGNEWQRNITLGMSNYLTQTGKAINSVGAYGPGYNANGTQMTDAQLTAQAKAVLGGK